MFGFDGVDFDWEFLGYEHGGQPLYGGTSWGTNPDKMRDCAKQPCGADHSKDGAQLVALLTELRQKFQGAYLQTSY